MIRSLCFSLWLSLLAPCLAEDWPQWMGVRRDGVWREEGLVTAFPPEGLPVCWRTPVRPGYAGPSVAEGRVYVMDRLELPREGDAAPSGIPGKERLLCLDAETGKVVWEREWPALYTIDYPAGPRATPTVHEGLVYALGAEGHLACFKADTGELVWEHELKEDYKCSAPTWGFAGHPLVYEDMLLCLVGGEGSTAVAFDRKTGKERWKTLSAKQAGYCPPTLVMNGGKPDLLLWHAEAISSLDPATGQVRWTIPRETRFGVSMAMPRQWGQEVLISSFWWGGKLLRLKEDFSEPDVIWETQRESDRRTEHLNALMCTPLVHKGHIYGVCSYGQLRCLEWKTGRRKWETFAATTGGGEERWATAFLTQLGDSDRFLLFNEKGELILAELTPEAYREISRVKIVEPDCRDVRERPVVWSHPAYANKRAYIRNNSELVCVDLSAPTAAE